MHFIPETLLCVRDGKINKFGPCSLRELAMKRDSGQKGDLNTPFSWWGLTSILIVLVMRLKFQIKLEIFMWNNDVYFISLFGLFLEASTHITCAFKHVKEVNYL